MAPRSTPSPEPESGRWESPGLRPPELSGRPIPLDGLEDGFLSPASPFQEWLLPQRLLGWKDRLASTFRGNGSPAWAQPGQEDSPAQPPGRWKPQWTKLWVAMKENRAAAGDTGTDAEELPKLGGKDSEIEKPSPACKEENSSAAGSLPKPAMGTPEAGEVYLEGSPAGEEKSEAGNGNESRRPSRWLCPTVNALALAKKGAPTQKSWQEADGEQNPPDPLQTYK
ncbi:RUN and SH3 domain-containing protein 1, partial [Ophiophagus hannah]